MSDQLAEFIQSVDALIKNLSPAERRNILRRLSIELRKRNADRVKANIQPSGSAMSGRNGDRWQMRGLKAGQTLKRGQKFNYFSRRDISLAYLRDDGTKIIGRQTGEPKQVQGYLRDNIYLRGKSTKKLKMFKRMSNAKYLRAKSSADEAVIGFLGGITAKIAAEHHYGDSKKKLPARELVGLSDEDIVFVETEILKAVSQGV